MGIAEEPVLMQRHRLTVDEYYRMGEAGILAPDARVELIDGEVVDMAPMKSAHASAMADLMRLLVESTGRRGFVTCQTPLRIDDRSEPEPDLMILLPRADKYAKAHPRPADVLLLVEVSDTTARYDRNDRNVKVPLYAAHGVFEVWIVDLEKRMLRFFRQPSGGQYLDITATETPGLTPVQALPGLTVDLAGLLP